MEYLQIFDQNGNPVNAKIARKRKKETPNGFYIKTVIVYIENSKGEFLIQKTSNRKGNEWATTGGHVPFGISSLDTMHNEILEELGFNIPKEKLQFMRTEINNLFPFAMQDNYFAKIDIDIESLHLQKEEVEFVKWMTTEEIEELIKKSNFRKGNIDFFKYLVKQ